MFREALSRGVLPEYHGGELGSIYDHAAGECPHHLEAFADHATWVIDRAVELAGRYELSDYRRMTLVTAATWHDVGKMVDRIWKERHVCPACGRSHGGDVNPGTCRTDGCDGIPETMLVVGYHGHAQTGSSMWMWGNIAARLGVHEPMRDHVRRLIRLHSDVHARLVKGRGLPRDPLAVLLSWADELGRSHAEHADVTTRLAVFPAAYESVTKG
jgi:hypothetical protein